MEFAVFQMENCFVLAVEPLCARAQTRVHGADFVGRMDTSSVGEMTSTMLEAAVDGDGFFCIGLQAAHILFRAAGGIRPLEQASLA